MLFIVGVTTLAAFFILKKSWSHKRKKIVFTLVTAFFLFPVLIPAGAIAAIPAPNFFFLAANIFGNEFFQIPVWYFKTAIFTVPSFMITALIMFGISHVVFFKRKQ